MYDFSLHTTDKPLLVEMEMPFNSRALRLADGAASITLYLSIEQWWVFRNLPKAPNYSYHFKDGSCISNHAEADAAAAQFYFEAKAEQVGSTAIQEDMT